MTLQSVSLSALEPAAANPRRKFDRKSIEGLAASIKTDGVLHNLVVSPMKGGKGRKERFQIVSGSRRFEALRLLQQRGELPEDFTVAVEVRDNLSTDDALRIATVENLQRQNMSPLEETAALTKLVHKGVTLEDVVSQTGLSATTIKRRLALASLCREAKQALTGGEITLSQAEALTLGGQDLQQRILDEIARGEEFNANAIKAVVLDERPTLALAIFPLEKHTGTVTTDLFADEETSYFDDAGQFFALQQEAVAELARHHEATSAWVEVTQDYAPPDWRFSKARKNQEGGVLINLAPSGRVEIREGLARPRVDAVTVKALAENPVAPAKAKAAYSTPLCRSIAHHKTTAVAEVLLASPRAAQEVALVGMLSGLRLHEAIRTMVNEDEPQGAYRVLEGQARQFAAKLGFAVAEDVSVWKRFGLAQRDELALYEAVKGLSDHDLAGLQALLTALSFKQEECDRLDTRDSLFNRVARDLNVDMRNHWRPDAAFFSRRSRDQLVAIARECGYADGHGSVSSFKKSELVPCLIRHFQHAWAAAEPTPAQQKAREWLPDAMRFPAVDPAAPAVADEDAGEE